MNKNLKNQIKAYAGVAGVILSAEKLNAQVQYVDINPDSLIELPSGCCSVSMDLDLDNDGTKEFVLKVWGQIATSGTSVTASSLLAWGSGNNKMLADASLGWYPLALQNGNYIGNTGIWKNGNGFLLQYIFGNHYEGNWFVGDDKCLGVRFSIASQTHCGWVHLEIIGPKAMKLKDYAYQLQPNVPMLACDTTNLATGIFEHTHLEFNFYQQNNSIHISSFQKLNHATISVYDLLGKEILHRPFENKQITITIDKKEFILLW